MKRTKRIVSILLSAAIGCSAWAFSAASTVSAAAISDYVTYDAYGNVVEANWPDEYPTDFLVVEDEATINAKINALMDQANGGLTDEEKFDMISADGVMGGNTSGHDIERRYGTGYWKGVSRLGIPIVRMYDGPMGVRQNTGYETTRPTNEVSLASTFDKETAYEYGQLYGEENKANSGNNQLGIQNDLIRTLTLDRSRDMFGEDWYLSGTITAAMSNGLQDENVMATLKHLGGLGNIDEQTLHENYLGSTEIAVKEGNAVSIMTNYQTTNGVSACADSYILKNVLRDMWGYKGLVMTDWGGNYGFTVDKGVTMETPSGSYNNANNIKSALSAGTITMDDVDNAVRSNLYALAQVGYLYMVQVGRSGVAVDNDPPSAIELPDVLVGEARQAMLERNNQKAIELAEKGAVLLKNDDNTLPLSDSDDTNIALIGFGSTYLIAGHQHECSFGSLMGLTVSPYKAISETMSNAAVKNYVAQDIVGEPIPGEYLYTDAEATTNGAHRIGTDGHGKTVDVVDEDINFITNSITYKNADDGTAFEYGDQGHNYTWTTYLKAPETGTYRINVQGIAIQEYNAFIEIDGEEERVSATGGSADKGTVGDNSIVATDTGLDIPSKVTSGGWGGGQPSDVEFDLEAGKTYKLTISADGSYADGYDYQRGVKDMQVQLAWITPSQTVNNYSSAVAAAGTPDTDVVLFVHKENNDTNGSMFGGGNTTDPGTLNKIDDDQVQLMEDTIAAAKAAGNKITLVLSTSLPVQLQDFVDDVDAILEMWLPGQGGGTAIANLLSGKTNPSGKLSVTWPKDFGADQFEVESSGRVYAPGEMQGFTNNPTEVKEGIYNGYKWYDAADKQDDVLYDFGYGLSYTDFEYELVSVEEAATGVDTLGYDLEIKVTNKGTVAGSDAPQVYIGAAEQLENAIYSPYDVADSWTYVYGERADADESDSSTANYFPEINGIQQAKYQLVGYERTNVIEPGQSDTVTIHVNQRALSYWDVSLDDFYVRSDGTKDKYTVIEGDRDLYIGKSSDDFVATETVTVDADGSNTPDPGNEGANKDTLKRVIEYAEAQMQKDEYKYVVADVKEKFEAALADAKAVYDDPKATQADTYEAWTTLMKWTQALSMQSGDKTLLLEAIAAAGGINLENFVSNGQDEFKAAFEEAKTVYNTELVDQDTINAATNRLIDAMLELRLKADKAILDSLLLYAKSINISLYTTGTVKVLQTGITASEDVISNEELSVDDQDVVDDTVSTLQSAIDGLVLKTATGGNNNNGTGSDGNNDGSGPNNPGAGSGSTGSGSGSAGNPKTGESSTLPLIILALAALAGCIFTGKRRNQQ